MRKTITQPAYFELVEWLTDARKHQGLTMRGLSQVLNKPHSFVQNVENCERRLDVYEYCCYCRALQLNPQTGIKKLLKSL